MITELSLFFLLFLFLETGIEFWLAARQKAAGYTYTSTYRTNSLYWHYFAKRSSNYRRLRINKNGFSAKEAYYWGSHITTMDNRWTTQYY